MEKMIMSYLIVINGPLGCGKTTNAKQLATALQACYISLDQTLKDHDLEDIESDAGIKSSSFIKALNIILPEARKCLEQGQNVVFDGCFYYEEVLNHLTEQLDFSHYVFTLRAPLEVCIERDRTREKPLGEDAARAVFSLVSENQFGTIIDASGSFKETQEKILAHLPK